MTTLFNSALISAVAICCLGCGEVVPPAPSQADRDAFQQLIDTRLELTDLLRGITDEASASEASLRYADVFSRYRKWTDTTNEIPIPLKTPIRRDLRDQLNDSMSDLHSEFSRLAALPEVATILRLNSGPGNGSR